MYQVNRSALVGHSAQQMFELVNDVARYQEFLPWCGGSAVICQRDDEYTAAITIAFKGVQKTFVTRNRTTANSRIDMALERGPFSDLRGNWGFEALEEATSRIVLELEFGFSNRIVGTIVGPLFHSIADSMVHSFCARADQIYGKK